MREGQPCDIEVVTKDGRRLRYEDVILIKYYHRGGTLKVKFLLNDQIRELRTVQLVEYNDLEVYL